MPLLSWYETFLLEKTDDLLADNSDKNNNEKLDQLIYLARWDERALFLILRDRSILDRVVERIGKNVDATRLMTAAMYYPETQDALATQFVPIAAKLAQYEDWRQGSALADLLGAYATPDSGHLELFNYSESYRHLIISRNLLAQRGTLKLLAFLFSDDFLQDAVSVLQYKSDILNHVNRIFVETPDFHAWRYSVRVMSLAGGYNEDRGDVQETERLCLYVTRMLPEFLLYFSTAFAYGMVRFFPKRARGKIPKWLRRRRALLTGAVCGALGAYSNTFCQLRLDSMRQEYDFLRHQEMRRRRGAERRQVQYNANTYFDSIEPMTRRVWLRQARDYAVVGGVLVGCACIQLPKINFPPWCGDVVFRWPFLPTFFPSIVGLPCTSRSLVPYLFVPFCVASFVQNFAIGGPVYDWYVHQRYAWWKQYRSEDVLEW